MINRNITIELNGIPPSLNKFVGRKNDRAYQAAKREWTDRVLWAIKAQRCAPAKPFDYAHVTIAYYFPNRNRHDADNYSGKLFLDGLTRGGIIVDDDMKHIATTIVGKYCKGNPRTVIMIREINKREYILKK